MSLYTVDVYSGSSDSIIRDPHAQGVIIKATQGTGYVNPACNHQYALATSLSKLLGLYHYAGGGNPEAEAQYFVNNIRNYVGTAVLILDWESFQNASWGNTTWARRFVNEVHRLTGVWCLIYVQESALWQVASCASDCGLWVAKYASMNWNSWSVPNMSVSAGAFGNITGWQYTGGDMDRSIFYIDANAWGRIANPNAKPKQVTSGGYLDSVTFDGNKFKISGWFQDGENSKNYNFIIVTNKNETHEYGRVPVQLTQRPDVAKVYPKMPGAATSGFVGELPYLPEMAGQDCQIIFRKSSDPNGNSNFTDFTTQYTFNHAQAWIDDVSATNGKLHVGGWFASDKSINKNYRFLILWDADTKRELGRYAWKPEERPDVQNANQDIYQANLAGFNEQLPYDSNLIGTNIQIVMRYSDAQSGEGNNVDYWSKPLKYPENKTVPVKPTQPTQATKPVQPTQPSKPVISTELLVNGFTAEPTKDGKIKITYK